MIRRMSSFILAALVLTAAVFLPPLDAAETAPIKPGDTIATTQPDTPLKSGDTTLLTLPKGTGLTAEEINGDWVRVTVNQDGKKITGWVYARHLARDGSSADRKASNTFLLRAADLFNNGDLDGALDKLNKAIRLDPSHAEAYQARGDLWRNKNELDKAIADCTEAIRLDPQLATAYTTRGAAWCQKGDFDKAIADCTEAIRLDPKQAFAYGVRGEASQKRGFVISGGSTGPRTWTSEEVQKGMNEVLDKSIADYEHAIHLNPRFAPFYLMRAEAWRGKGALDKAIAGYTETIRVDPKNVSAYVARAGVLAEKNEYDRAIADCTEAIRLDQQLAQAYLLRRMVRKAKGDQDGATADLAEARRNCPGIIKDGYCVSMRAGERGLPMSMA